MPLKGKGLKFAHGMNTNPFFNTPEIKDPVFNSGTHPTSLILKKVYEYDVSTRKGEIIEIRRR